MKFNSIPEAIDNRGSYLKRMYFDQGQTTLPAIRDGWNGKQWNPDIGHTPFYPLRQHYIGGPAVPIADYTKE